MLFGDSIVLINRGEGAQHIWMGAPSPLPRLRSSALRFSPACLTPVKNSATLRPWILLMIHEVKTPVRSGFGGCPARPYATTLERSRRDASRRLPAHASIFIGVSSPWSTSSCAACRHNSSQAGSIVRAVSRTMSHCVEDGSGIPTELFSLSRRFQGNPLPYFNSPIMLDALASYFSPPAPAGGCAVKTFVQRLHRSHWRR